MNSLKRILQTIKHSGPKPIFCPNTTLNSHLLTKTSGVPKDFPPPDEEAQPPKTYYVLGVLGLLFFQKEAVRPEGPHRCRREGVVS